MPRVLIVLIFLYSFTDLSYAATVDTVAVFSSSMHKSIPCVVVKPDNYKKKGASFPVVYLLHGYGGSYSNLIKRVPELKAYTDFFQMLIVCPDGGYSSWYFDSPIDSSYKYETYISKELVTYIDTRYKTIKNNAHRAIAGLSMGGHGAIFIGLRHPNVFGAAGSMSGGVNLWESKNKFDIAKRIGDTVTHAKEWQEWSIVNLIEKYSGTPLKLIIDCGTNDMFINSNRQLHEKMLLLHISHDYIERPGEHNWAYWKNSIPYQLLFFNRYFNGY